MAVGSTTGGVPESSPIRRGRTLGALLMSSLALCGSLASACPVGPVRLIVPVVAGGPLDHLARGLASELAVASGQVHVVENRSGGMTIPAWDAAAKAAPDGCTLLVASISGRVALPWQVARLPFDAARDLQPVSPLADVPQLFVAHPSVGVRTLAELVDKARRNPGGVSIALPTPGALTHLAAVALQREAGIRLNEIPYRGGAPAALAVRSGEVAMMSADIGAVLALVKRGELVALATASSRRLPQLPEVPTVAEAGFGDLEAANVYALFAPTGLTPTVLKQLHARTEAALRKPTLSEPLLLMGMVPRTAAPALFEAELQAAERRFAPIAREAARIGN